MKISVSFNLQRLVLIACFILLGVGIFMRFHNITKDDFFLYDEGYYLNYNHLFVNLWTYAPPSDWDEWKQSLLVWFRFSMASGKALWFLLIDSRIFFGGLKVFFFPRVVSAIAGSLALWVTYLFSKKIFNSKWVGILSAVFLAILPSHVFYSRLAFQEALSTVFFISGFYFYVFPQQLNRRTFISAVLLVGAYFTNYRLVIIPALVAFCEFITSVTAKRRPDFRKYVWHTLTFLFFIIMIGNIDMKENALVTYSWMLHQADMAQEQLSFINVFSYPYYLFTLESFWFGLLFLGNIYYGYKKEWPKIFPFAMVCFQMMIFSLTAEKAARYLCVVTPFMAMAVASLLVDFIEQKKEMTLRVAGIILCLLTTATLLLKSNQIVFARSDYKPSIEYLLANDPNAKILSTQPWVQNLYVTNKKNVQECPHKFEQFLAYYTKGFRYLILCPQSYISWTKDEKRFTPQLETYLGFIATQVKPAKTFSHLDRVMLERFVFDHNENLIQSIIFLNSANRHLGEIRVYDMETIIAKVNQWMSQQKKVNSN